MKITRLLLLPLLMLSAFYQPSLAADQEFDTFWKKFKTALLAKDKNTVAAMTKLPFLFDSKQLSKKDFLANYDKIFSKDIATCLKKEKPVKDAGSYLFFCGETIYVISKANGKYMFTDIGVND